MGERQQLARMHDAVALRIDPDPELAEGRIVGIDHAVAVAVQGAKGCEAVEDGPVLAKQFGDVVDLAVAVSVNGQQARAGADPAGLAGKSVALQVEVG